MCDPITRPSAHDQNVQCRPMKTLFPYLLPRNFKAMTLRNTEPRAITRRSTNVECWSLCLLDRYYKGRLIPCSAKNIPRYAYSVHRRNWKQACPRSESPASSPPLMCIVQGFSLLWPLISSKFVFYRTIFIVLTTWHILYPYTSTIEWVLLGSF